MERKKMVAANWKMNLSHTQGAQLARDIVALLPKKLSTDVILIPPFTAIESVGNAIKMSHQLLQVGAQNLHHLQAGAYTGEIAAPMLRALGVSAVLVGHSERRQYFSEDANILVAKIKAALAADLKVIFCFGEPDDIRQSGKENEYVWQQRRRPPREEKDRPPRLFSK